MSKQKKVFTQLQALTHLVSELENILQLYNKTFNRQINGRLNRLMDHVLQATEDEQFIAWLTCHGIRGYTGKMTVGEVLGPYLRECREALRAGHVPVAPAVMLEEDLYSMEWWDPANITLTDVNEYGHQRGTSTVLNEDGLYKLALTWELVTGPEADDVGLPAMLNIVSAGLLLPSVCRVVNDDGEEVDILAAAQELDFIHGFSAAILNEVYPDYES